MLRVEPAFRQNHLNLNQLVGTLTTPRRDENLRRFQSDPDCNILLASMQAAGVGIDLRCAQNVYLMVGWFHVFHAHAKRMNNYHLY